MCKYNLCIYVFGLLVVFRYFSLSITLNIIQILSESFFQVRRSESWIQGSGSGSGSGVEFKVRFRGQVQGQVQGSGSGLGSRVGFKFGLRVNNGSG